MPGVQHSVRASDVHASIRRLINNLINITDTTGEFLFTLPDGRLIDSKGWSTGWEWTHGIGLYGIWKYYEFTNDPQYLKIIQDWFRPRFEAYGTTKNINTMSVFLTLACVYEKTRDLKYLPWLDAWAQWAMYELERTEYGGMQHVTYLTPNTQQLRDDTLMMTVLPLAKIGQVLNRPQYIEECKRQFLIHLKYLYDTSTGLFFHGWTFNEGGHNFARALWGRGNSWLTIVIPEFIELLDLQPGDFFRHHLVDKLHSQCVALKKLQDRDCGLWYTILDAPMHAKNYFEASASAGFAYGILKATRKRYLAKAEFEPTAVKAVKAILANIDDKGELQQASFGTPVGERSKEFYMDIPKTAMPNAQAMAIMALVEFLRQYC